MSARRPPAMRRTPTRGVPRRRAGPARSRRGPATPPRRSARDRSQPGCTRPATPPTSRPLIATDTRVGRSPTRHRADVRHAGGGRAGPQVLVQPAHRTAGDDQPARRAGHPEGGQPGGLADPVGDRVDDEAGAAGPAGDHRHRAVEGVGEAGREHQKRAAIRPRRAEPPRRTARPGRAPARPGSPRSGVTPSRPAGCRPGTRAGPSRGPAAIAVLGSKPPCSADQAARVLLPGQRSGGDGRSSPTAASCCHTSRVAVDRFRVMKWMPGTPSSSSRAAHLAAHLDAERADRRLVVGDPLEPGQQGRRERRAGELGGPLDRAPSGSPASHRARWACRSRWRRPGRAGGGTRPPRRTSG